MITTQNVSLKALCDSTKTMYQKYDFEFTKERLKACSKPNLSPSIQLLMI